MIVNAKAFQGYVDADAPWAPGARICGHQASWAPAGRGLPTHPKDSRSQLFRGPPTLVGRIPDAQGFVDAEVS